MKRYIVLLIILVLSGCSMNLGTLSLVSTLEDNLDEEYESIGFIEGKDTQYMFLGIPTGSPMIDAAINDALIKNNAVYMTNTSVKYEQIFFLIYFGIMEYKIAGEGWAKVGRIERNGLEIEEIKKPETAVVDKKIKTPKKVKYDPKTGLPVKPTKYDPETGEPIYE